MDPRSDAGHPTNLSIINSLSSAGLPMRQRIAGGILHWKLMLFSGQGVVEFSGANYTGSELVYSKPYASYVDEAIYYADDPGIVNSFRTKFDLSWMDTVSFSNYANVTQLAPSYATYPVYSEPCPAVTNGCGMNFLPSPNWADNYLTKVQSAISAEKVKLDIDMFRITNAAVTNSTIAAFQRGLPIRMVVDWSEYVNNQRVWDRYNVDRLFMAGVPLKITNHGGQNHEKSLVFYGQNLTVWGSSNWTSPSSNSQQEHNFFSTAAVKPWFSQWFINHLERRWNSPHDWNRA